MLGAVAELERNLILERQREGIALAKIHGKYKGGQPKLTAQQVEEIKALVNNRTPITQIAKNLVSPDVPCTIIYEMFFQAPINWLFLKSLNLCSSNL